MRQAYDIVTENTQKQKIADQKRRLNKPQLGKLQVGDRVLSTQPDPTWWYGQDEMSLGG